MDISPDFKVANDQEMVIMKEEAMEEVFEEAYGRGEEEFLSFVREYGSDQGDNDMHQIIFRMFDFSQSQLFPDAWLEGCLKRFEISSEAELEKSEWLSELKPDIRNTLFNARAINDYIQQIAPNMVAMLSAMNALLILGMEPSSLENPACVQMATSEPIVSNMSRNSIVATTIIISGHRILFHSNWQNVLETDGGRETNPRHCVMPKGMPAMVVTNMPISSAHGTFLTIRGTVMSKPHRASKALPLVMSPRLMSVAGSETIMPAFCIPIRAMNSPIPAPMAFLIEAGMASTIQERMLVSVSITNRIPSISTAVRANCHE